MDKTIAGAASGEFVYLRRRRIHNLRQKDRRVTYHVNVILALLRLDKNPVSFLLGKDAIIITLSSDLTP
ncbi:hypothetical protein J2S74_004295 [Evansella vedderi]|uniref:Uncharacterized protein n=1 Tax=Evansella vedderi TaxID=38282 RepID=A0ABU0A053_9BACI|nr:hypothetical protein [Evansella vedderi]